MELTLTCSKAGASFCFGIVWGLPSLLLLQVGDSDPENSEDSCQDDLKVSAY